MGVCEPASPVLQRFVKQALRTLVVAGSLAPLQRRFAPLLSPLKG